VQLCYSCASVHAHIFTLDFSCIQFIEEAERSLHDAIMIVRRAMKNSTVVAGGGAIDVCMVFRTLIRSW
jgi:T-complex protein 1 subunit eta